MPNRPLFSLLFAGLLLNYCTPQPEKLIQLAYQSESLIIEQVSAHCWRHESYMFAMGFGKVACNGLIYAEGNEAWVFDTPSNPEASQELLGFLTDSLQMQVKGVVATHSHEDCLAGLDVFHTAQIPSWGYQLTLAFAEENGKAVPQGSYGTDTTFTLGDQSFRLWFAGEGHTLDNTVVYIPVDSTLFGGCLVKSLGSGYGYVGEADVDAWPKTAARILEEFPEVQHVVPGHGRMGNDSLLHFTAELFLAMPDSLKP
ncbi:MAG: subclass B1 metallo-beta-lactamase [Bacteroidota bacterium]